jgi:hypothetical protein
MSQLSPDEVVALLDGPARETDLLAGLRNGGWLDAQDFPPLRYAIPGLVPEGLSLIVGAPKIGNRGGRSIPGWPSRLVVSRSAASRPAPLGRCSTSHSKTATDACRTDAANS